MASGTDLKESCLQPCLPECGLLTHIVPLLIDQGQPLPHPLRLGQGGTVLCQVTPNNIDAHCHALVAVKVQQELSVVLDNFLKLLNVAWNSLNMIIISVSSILINNLHFSSVVPAACQHAPATSPGARDLPPAVSSSFAYKVDRWCRD